MKKIFIIFLLIYLHIDAQDKSISLYDLIKNTNTSHNLNSGTAIFNIPLYNINLEVLNLSSSINYTSKGFKPIFEPGTVGMNWDVNFFGKIVREVKNNELEQNNRLYYLTSILVTPPYTNFYDCINFSNGGYRKSDLINNPSLFAARYNPDKFYFDFFGYKGYFVIDNEGNPVVYCENGNLKVESSNIPCQSLYDKIQFSEFIINDDKGNKFFFGGDYNALDVNYTQTYFFYNYVNYAGNFMADRYDATTRTSYIIAWNLKTVLLANGRTISAEYLDQDQTLLNNYAKEGLKNPKNLTGLINFPNNLQLENNNLSISNINRKTSSSQTTYSPPPNSIPQSTTDSFETRNYYTKNAILKKINIEDFGYLNFFYQKSKNLLERYRVYIDSIEVRNNNNTLINSYKFVLNDFGNTNKRTFLSSLIINNIDKYEFEYQKTEDFPTYSLSEWVDQFGFWKDKSDVGLLKKITLPTKGYILYDYEPHTYHYSYQRTGSNKNDFTILQNINNNAGGTRLKQQIEISPDNQIVRQKQFFYVKPDGKSSGILDDNSIAQREYDYGFLNELDGGKRIIDTSLSSFFYSNEVKYSNVTEKSYDGIKKYEFTDHFTNPDSLAIKVYKDCLLSDNTERDPLFYKQNERGKIKNLKLYSLNGILLKEIDYKYKNFLNNVGTLQSTNENCTNCKITDDKYYVHIVDAINNNNNGVKCLYKKYIYVPVLPYLLTSKIEKEYFGNKIIETIINYEYNNDYLYWHPYPKKIKTTNSTKTETSEIYYPGDILKLSQSCITDNCDNYEYVGGKFSTYKNMISNNLNLPIININKNSYNKIQIKEFIYDKNDKTSNYFKPTAVRSSLSNSDFSLMKNVNTKTDIYYDLYDNKGNLLQFTSKDKIPTTIIWGYNQTLPIARIVGATYSEIMKTFNLSESNPMSYLDLDIVKDSNFDNDNVTEKKLQVSLDLFRKKDGFKNFLISTYTHDPLVDRTSEKSPNGTIEEYRYNSQNKLEAVIDDDGNIKKEYKYNYIKTPKYPIIYFNTEKSKIFERNNCSLYHDGGNFNYVVSQYTYNSSKSQLDADQKAIDDINYNGQRITNESAPCFSSTCTLNLLSLPIFDWVAYSLSPNKYHLKIRIYPKDIPNRNWTQLGNIAKLETCKNVIFEYKEFTFNEPDGGAFGETPTNRSWLVRIYKDGYIAVKLISGTIKYGRYDYITFEFDY